MWIKAVFTDGTEIEANANRYTRSKSKRPQRGPLQSFSGRSDHLIALKGVGKVRSFDALNPITMRRGHPFEMAPSLECDEASLWATWPQRPRT